MHIKRNPETPEVKCYDFYKIYRKQRTCNSWKILKIQKKSLVFFT